jgi:hypothetical protein
VNRSVLFRAAALLLFGIGSSASLAADGVQVLEPSSPWRMDYADQSCRLVRTFGTGDQQIAIGMERFGPGDSFYLSVAGRKLDIATENQPLTLRFGPVSEASRVTYRLGSVGDKVPAMFVSNARLVPLTPSDPSTVLVPLEGKPALERGSGEASGGHGSTKLDIDTDEITPAQEAAVQWLEIDPGRKQKFHLNLGSLGSPMEAMRTCTDELMSHWGVPRVPPGPGSKAAVAIRPGNWLTDLDYPSGRLGQRAIVYFRVHVGADGTPRECAIVKLIGDQEFADITCKNIMRRAKFTPAMDGFGTPAESSFMSSVFFNSE